jgi:alpha-tubulin suppressor-like RCC1 family protein
VSGVARGRRSGGSALLVGLAVLLAGCAFPVVEVVIVPGGLTVVAGDAATFTVNVANAVCDPDDDLPCVDITGQLLDYHLQHVPAGVAHSIDRGLQSESTPGVVRVTFDVGAATPPGRYEVAVHAVLSGHLLGTGVLVLRVLPPALGEMTAPPVAVAAGAAHVLAALADGTVRAWGDNIEGQLGLGDRLARTVPTAVPVPVFVVAVAASRNIVSHSLALGADGSVWAWGVNEVGQLGLGDDRARLVPTQVPGLGPVKAIATDNQASLALATDGTVWFWGKLGESASHTPVPVPGLADIAAVSAGALHALAVRADGTVWAWGNNRSGQLGIGSASGFVPDPVEVPGLTGVVAVAAGTEHSLALKADGTVWAWGRNASGQLGDGTFVDRPSPTPVANLSGVHGIASGTYHSLARNADGTVWAWGANHGGKVNGELPDVPDPFHLPPTLVPGLAGAHALAGGGNNSLAVVDCGQLWVWGSNDWDLFGDGTSPDRPPAPAPVPGLGDDSACPRVALRASVTGTGGGGFAADVGALACRGGECAGLFDRGSVVTLTAASSTAVFEGWGLDCSGTDPQATVVLDRSRRCVGRFRAEEPFLLRVISSGGRVTSSGGGIFGPAGIDCGDTCAAIFPEGTLVDLTAAESAGFGFSGWGGDCGGTVRATSVVMDGPRACRADFRAFTLAVTVTGEGRVTSAPPGLDCDDACSYEPRAGSATLTAAPSVGWQFDGWGGDCAGAALEHTVAMDADRTCTASFSRIPGLFFLTMTIEGQGSVTSAPAGIDCPGTCVALYPAGTAVDLTAHETPATQVFSWFDDCDGFRVTTSRVVMDDDRTCRVRFEDRPLVPVANISAPLGPVVVGEVVTFDGSASHMFDPATGTRDFGAITSYTWDVGDDGTIDGTGPLFDHAFPTAGVSPVRLRVRGGPFDAEDDAVIEMTVLDRGAACMTLTQTSAGPFTWTVQADGSCSAGPIAQYRWWMDFNFAEQPPTFVTTTPVPPPFEYEAPGTYDVRLQVIDALGSDDAIVVPFTVQ